MTNLDLDAITLRTALGGPEVDDVAALIAEVYRLRAIVDAAVEYRAKHRLYGAVSHMELFAAVDAYVGNKP